MPILLVMRHAKSEWDDVHCEDHDRPLNLRGKRDAPRMGRWLRQQGLIPSRIVSSSAKRARKTAERLVDGLQAAVPIDVREDLYHATVEHWLQVLTGLDTADECVLCIGHNPGLEGLVEQLASRFERLPTASIAVFDFTAGDWSRLGTKPAPVKLRTVWRPKELPADSDESTP